MCDVSEDAVGPGQLQVIAETGAPTELIPPAASCREAVRERSSIVDAVRDALADPAVTRLAVVAASDLPDAFCSAVVSRVMVSERLDVEIALVLPRPTPAGAIYGLPTGAAAATLAIDGTAQELPLIRDDMAVVLLGEARQRGVDGPFDGESYVDSDLLVRGSAKAIIIEPTTAMPGVRARLDKRFRARWHSGRAAQSGAPALIVERDGVTGQRPVKRSTFYRHQHNWKLVRP